jgi:hypothetical protein
MKPPKHTPGPWEWSSDDDGHLVRMGDAVDSPGTHASHNLWKCEHMIDPEAGVADRRQFAQAEANAQLIAAAPDLLEALKQARHWIAVERHPALLKDILALIDPAIAKAEGG